MSEYQYPLTKDMIDGPPWKRPNWTPEEIAERCAWIDHYVKRMEELDEIEPLPENFEDLCKGRAIAPVYAK